MGLDMYLTAGPLGSGKELGYWRKANAIHAWFITHVGNGVDDYEPFPVSREQLRTLRDTCIAVRNSTKLVPGRVFQGIHYTPGKPAETLRAPGLVLEDPSVALEKLPTASGFFFGCTEYDERYMTHITNTIKILDRTLNLPDHIQVFYTASW